MFIPKIQAVFARDSLVFLKTGLNFAILEHS